MHYATMHLVTGLGSHIFIPPCNYPLPIISQPHNHHNEDFLFFAIRRQRSGAKHSFLPWNPPPAPKHHTPCCDLFFPPSFPVGVNILNCPLWTESSLRATANPHLSSKLFFLFPSVSSFFFFFFFLSQCQFTVFFIPFRILIVFALYITCCNLLVQLLDFLFLLLLFCNFVIFL